MAYKMKGSKFYGKGNSSPVKQKRVKRKPKYTVDGNTAEDVEKEQREKDLAKWKENKNADIRFFEKHTGKDGKIDATSDDYMNEWKKRMILKHAKEVVKKSKNKNKPIT